MMLTQEQLQALDAATDAPARVIPHGSEVVHVLLPVEDFDWIRGLVKDIPDAPRMTDPRTQKVYALIPESVYERFKAFFEEDPISPEERRRLLQEFGKRAGWDDP